MTLQPITDPSHRLTAMRVLVVDDNAANVELIDQVLRNAEYTEVRGTQDPNRVANLCQTWAPDLVLLDLHMPAKSGYDVMAAIGEHMAEPESLPVLVLTADVTLQARQRALSMGARDFVNKPIDHTELLLRVRNLLQTRRFHQQLRQRNELLDHAVRVRTSELEQARLESLSALARVSEYRDDETFHHTERVGRTAALIARALDLDAATVAAIRLAAPLHDIGKVGIPDHILLKPGKHTPQERETFMRHTEIGAQILADTRSPVLRTAADIARTHHERWDGKGYLTGMQGADIPLAGRITAIADVFDALTHERPYKPAWDMDRALAEIANQAGRQFDPRAVTAFASLDPKTLVHPAVQNTAGRDVA